MTPKLIAITDRSVASSELMLERFGELGRLARPRSVAFQLRDLELPIRERLSFGRALADLARETKQLFVVNDRVDLAVLLEADGVHLGEASMDTADARRLLGEHAFVSRACHDPSRVATLDADAALLSPVVELAKSNPALGFAGIQRARAVLGHERRAPALFALGGVSAENAARCLDAGADGIAMIRGVLDANAIRELVRVAGIAR